MNIISIPALKNFPYEMLKLHNYDMQEIRLDYSIEPEKFIDRLLNYLPIDPITIVTLRDPSEGGIKPLPFDKKISMYKEFIERYNCLVDCELELFLKHKPDLPYDKLVLSKHFPLDIKDLESSLKEAIKAANQYSVRYLKLVAPVEKYSDLKKLRKLAKISKNPVIYGSTGSLGKLSRILWRYSGSLGTFTCLEGFNTANEQLTPDEYKLFGCRQIDEKTLFGGIIGGEQVYESLGLIFYNQRLRSIDNKIVYLPFPVNDPKDFINWLKEFNEEVKFYGFSVTMPHKRIIPELFGITDKIFNLISVKTDRDNQLPIGLPEFFFNTDAVAFKKAMNILQVKEKNTILVYGSGATARTFIKEYAYYINLMVTGRNSETAQKCAADFKIDYLPLGEKSKKKRFDLIVNCSPVGMNSEDFFSETGLSLPRKMIDLPYAKSRTAAIEKCFDNDIPCVDGHTFWLLQARKQEDIFSSNIASLIHQDHD